MNELIQIMAESLTSTNCEDFPNGTLCDGTSLLITTIALKEEEEIWTEDVIQRVVSIVIIMVLTFIGNTAIILVLTCSKYRKRNNRVNIFIINLAIGDLAVCFATMTTEILFVCFGEWVLGNFGCKLLTYIQVVTLSSTTFILAAMGFDRYMAICRPLRFTASSSRSRSMIIVSWCLSFVVSIPQLFIFKQTVDGVHSDQTLKYGCHSQGYTAPWQRKTYITFMSFYILIFPSVLLSFCYINVARVVWKQGRSETYLSNSDISLRRFIVNKGIISLAKMKTVKMTFCIILTFIACWTPYFVTTLCLIYSNYTLHIPNSVMAFAETIALLQSAVNPVVYGIFNIQIFRGLAEVFCPKKLKPKRPNSLAKYHNINGFYCMSATDGKNRINLTDNSNHLAVRCHDRQSRSATSSEDGSLERPQSSTSRSHGGCIIAESNMNGFKLRVRFMTKEHVIVHDRHGRRLYPGSNPRETEKQLECTV
ncbi:neuropeptide S receptor-like [Ruditapes philippinarum]|uniref:neuropeptide S receptor-like n=1 Tax=Ruditapes philippinarum TaxID=129788 RepID=UPI00295B8D80|nr:neuropeptide S receptor-like [Ruditapes philippinarum]